VPTEGRILTAADVAGGNPVRTVQHTTQAADEAAPSVKDTQVFVQGDPDTATSLVKVTASGAQQVNMGASSSTIPTVAASLTAAGLSTLAGTGSTAGSAVVNVADAGNVSFHLVTSAFVGTLVFEQSFDPAGAAGTWAPVPCLPEDGTGPPVATLAINTAAAYVRQFTAGMFGPALFRVRVNAFTSGSVATLLKPGPGWVEGQPALAPSTAVIGAASLVGGPTSSLTSVTIGTTATQIYAADTTRRGALLWNTSTANNLMIAFGATPTASLYAGLLPPGTGWRVDPEFAQLSCIGIASAAGTVVNINPVAL
jgi:outer membrane protein assembly factor BamB